MNLLSVRCGAVALALAFTVGTASAGVMVTDYKSDFKTDKSGPAELPFDPFAKGSHEVQAGVGGFYSLSPGTQIRPKIHLAVASVRHGWMLSTPEGDGCFRGNTEFLVELFGGGAVQGPGGMLAGFSLLVRYNFVQPDARLVPYAQIGAGGLYNSIHENHPQRIIGSAFEFNLEAAIGVRYLFNDRFGIFAEAGFRHISNAGIASRNSGLNAIGGVIGASWFY